MAATLDMPSLGKFYRRQLLEDVLPFWFPRAYDEKNGGLYHCFDADGTLVDSNGVWVEIDNGFLARRGLTPTRE